MRVHDSIMYMCAKLHDSDYSMNMVHMTKVGTKNEEPTKLN